jgi:putative oxidoreductase
MRFFNTLQPVAVLLMRVALGVIFITHGYSKLAKPALGMQALFVQHGLPGYFVYVSGILEVFGGGLLLLGLFARVAGLLLAIEMTVAIFKIHSGGGILAVHNYEFPLSLGVAAFALSAIGPGLISIDAALFSEGGAKPRGPKSARK